MNRTNKRGRPAKIEGTILNQKLSIRISESEHDALITQAHDLNTKVSDMVRFKLADMLAV